MKGNIMSDNIQSLWPDQIRPRILSPLAILKAQGDALAIKTGGVLLADIKSKEIENDRVALTFDIVVPALNDYHHRILSAGYSKDLPYPVVVDAEIFRSQKTQTGLRAFLEAGFLGELANKPINRADSDQEFIALVSKVLKSPQVLSAAQSLIARATDALDERGQQDQPARQHPLELPPDTNVNGYSKDENPGDEKE
jgi:hypothetical protein